MSKNLSVFQYGQTKVIFGESATSSLLTELERLGVKKPFIVSDKVLSSIGMLEGFKTQLFQESVSFVLYDQVEPDPKSTTVDEAVQLLKESNCDGVIGIGGGSVLDCAKCIAAMATNEGTLLDYDHANPLFKNFSERSLPLISIPTTAGTGSEVSPYAVITNELEQRKATIGSPSLMSSVVIEDPTLLINLPKKTVASTGLDALTHCIEAYTSVNSLSNPNPIMDALALKGISLITKNLKTSYNTNDKEPRQQVLWGSLIGGIVLQYGSGAAHGLGNVLGGQLHVPHGEAVGMLLPYVMEFNKDVCNERYLDIANAMGIQKDAGAVSCMINELKKLLKEMKFSNLSNYINDESELETLSLLAIKDKCTRINGKQVDKEAAIEIYRKALGVK